VENEVGVTAVFVIVNVSDECVSNVSRLMKLGDKQPVIKTRRREDILKWVSGE
jgi:hypothetical protein